MMNKNNIYTGLILIFALAMGANATAQESVSGIYERSSDYIRGDVIKEGAFERFDDGKIYFEEQENHVVGYNVNARDWWGYRNNKGHSFRFYKNQQLKVILDGPFCIYGDAKCDVTRDQDGEVMAVSCDQYFYSPGIDANIQKLNDETFRSFIQQRDTELFLKYQNTGGGTYARILSIARMYNEKYEGQ